MTAKELVMEIIVNKVQELEEDIRRLSEVLAEKERELEKLTNFLEKEDEED